jgi:FkbM family methyltransferase
VNLRKLESCTVSLLDRNFEVFGYTDDTIFQDIKSKRTWRAFNLSHLENLISPDDICLDLGANLGMMTLALSVLAPNGHVYGFEASPETTLALKQTIRANALSNVSVSNVVVGCQAQTVKFFDMPDAQSSGHYVDIEMPVEVPSLCQDSFQVVVAETKSVDQLVEELSLKKVDFIKIDVEGAELDVLQGATGTFNKFSPLIAMEFNSYAFVHYREIAPRTALKRILDTFDEVYYFKNRTGELLRLGTTERERERFLHENLLGGLVDDLLCAFKETRLVRSGVLTRQIRG